MFGLLRRKNFALLWAGSSISTLGDQVLNTALIFYVYRLTGSVLVTGALTVLYFVPMVLFGSVAGVFVDRWRLKPTLVVTNLAQAAVLLPLLAVHTADRVWIAAIIAFTLSLLSLFVGPATNVLVPRLVGRDRLVAANALTSLGSNVTRLIGPPIGGVLLATTGTTAVVIVDCVSFVVAAGMLAAVAIPPGAPSETAAGRTQSAVSKWVARWRDWADGLRLIRRQRMLAAAFGVGAVATVADAMLGPLLVPFVRDFLRGNAATYGWISMTTGLGGLAGALVIGRVAKRQNAMRLVAAGLVAVGVVAAVRYNVLVLWVSFVTFLAGGIGAVVRNVGRTTVLQAEAPETYRGRVFGASNTTTALALLAGSALASVLGDVIGVQPLLEFSALLYLLAGALASWPGATCRRRPADSRDRR